MAQIAVANEKFSHHRRLIGRRFDDPTVKKDMESWPFTVLDDGGNPKIEVEYLGEKKSFSAQEISAMVLLKVRFSPTCPISFTSVLSCVFGEVKRPLQCLSDNFNR